MIFYGCAGPNFAWIVFRRMEGDEKTMPSLTYYQSSAEQINACVQLVYARLSAAFLQSMDEENRDLHGVSLRMDDIERILTPKDDRAARKEMSAVRQAEAVQRSRARRSQHMGIRLPLEELAQAFRLTAVQRFLVHFALAMEFEIELERVVAFLQEDMQARTPTLGLALRLYELTDRFAPEDIFANSDVFQMLFRPVDSSIRPIAWPLRLHPRIMEFLMNPDAPAAYFKGIAENFIQSTPLEPARYVGSIVQDMFGTAQEVMPEDGERFIGMLCGAPGSGKRLVLRHVAAMLDRELLVADVGSFAEDPERVAAFAVNLLRECRLKRAIPAFRFTQKPEAAQIEGIRALISAMEEDCGVLWFLSDVEWSQASVLAGDKWGFVKWNVPQLSVAQRAEWWNTMPGLDAYRVDVGLLSSKYAFTPGMIKRAFRDAGRIAKWQDAAAGGGNHIFSIACRQQLESNLGEHATLLHSPFAWDDLVLPPDKKEQLSAVCAQVRNNHIVFDDWGFARRMPYGRGLSVLFTGLPGTGKTMAAQVLANELDIEIYQVNLSAVISKYIGETEKNLEVVFTEGARSQCVLFFDEADALFAKRTDMKETKDRYANAESAYLLQRMEKYQGIVVMATNYPQNFDPAFRRRIKVTIDFPVPDVASRLLIWEKILASPVPLEKDLDLQLIAERFELTGSSIKNIAMAAAFAAAQDQRPIGRAHIQQAIRFEYAKNGRVMDTSF